MAVTTDRRVMIMTNELKRFGLGAPRRGIGANQRHAYSVTYGLMYGLRYGLTRNRSSDLASGIRLAKEAARSHADPPSS